MTELPCYVRVKHVYAKDFSVNYVVEEDEIIFLQALKEETWYEGERLSGDPVYLKDDNFNVLELPDLRKNELYFVASIAEYNSTHSEDISFAKNTIIIVSKDVDSSWAEGTVLGYNGKRLGRAGLFPKTFVVRLKRKNAVSEESIRSGTQSCSECSDKSAHSSLSRGEPRVWSPVNLAENSDNASTKAAVTGGSNDNVVVFRDARKDSSTPESPHAKTIFPFRGENDGELSFEAGRLVRLRRYVDHEWVEGELDGKVGLFPVSYVRVIIDLPGTFSIGGKPLRRTSRHSAIGIASVLYDFNGRQDDELTVRAGESVSVMELINTEWARCFDPGRGRTGIIPISFLNIFMDEDDEELSHEESSDSESFTESQMSGRSMFNAASDGAVSDGKEKPVISPVQGRPWSSVFDTTANGNLGIQFEEKDLDFFLKSENVSSRPMSEIFHPSKLHKKAPARPPPPKFSTVAKTAALVKRPPPPRPTALPKRSSLVSPTTSPESPVKSFSSATSTPTIGAPPDFFGSQQPFGGVKAPENDTQYIINDLISSELQYLSDIGMWEAVVQSGQINAEYKRILTNGLPELKDLSRLLVSQLVEQQAKPPEYQCIGHAFLALRDSFMKAFGLYFRSVESVIGVIGGKDQRLQQSLNDCVAEMRALGSNVFDAPTAVSRPIQRCLKYPLFIGALIKATPITHIDHPKLLEALKQMNLLVSKMNEFKRRKELVVKYRNAGAEPFTKRLSRLNMHTVKKKSNRFKYRLTSQIGLVHMDRDPIFDAMAENLDLCERRICKFLHALQVYKQLMVTQSKKYVETYTTAEKLAGNKSALNAEIRGFCKVLLEETSQLAQYLDDTLGTEAKKFLRLPITKVMQKRYDKLIDYVSARKEDKNPDEIHIKQCDYEALNNQLKATLPKVIENIKKRTFAFVETVVAKEIEFFTMFMRLREELSEEARSFFTLPFSAYVGSSERRLRTFLSIGKAISAEGPFAKSSSSSGSSTSSKKNSVEANKADVNRPVNTRVPQIPQVHQTPQTPQVPQIPPALPVSSLEAASPKVERTAPSSAVYDPVPTQAVVISPSGSNAGNNLIDLEDNLLDLVTPLQPQQVLLVSPSRPQALPPIMGIAPLPPTSQPQYELFDSSKTPPAEKTVVQSPIRQPTVAGTPLPMSADELLNDLLPNELDKTQILSSLDAPLIPYRPYDTITDVPLMRNDPSANTRLYPVVEVPSATPSATVFRPVIPPRAAVSLSKPKHFYDSTFATYDEPPQLFEPDHPDFERLCGVGGSPNEKKRLAPIRAAPPPPIGSGDTSAKNKVSLLYEPFRAEFDYNGCKECEVPLTPGEKVIVLKKFDDANNEDWWLVRKNSGTVGYVPANYLSPA